MKIRIQNTIPLKALCENIFLRVVLTVRYPCAGGGDEFLKIGVGLDGIPEVAEEYCRLTGK